MAVKWAIMKSTPIVDKQDVPLDYPVNRSIQTGEFSPFELNRRFFINKF